MLDASAAALDVIHLRRHADAPRGDLGVVALAVGLEQQHAVAAGRVLDSQVLPIGVLVRLFLDADIVVQAVMLGLVFDSRYRSCGLVRVDQVLCIARPIF